TPDRLRNRRRTYPARSTVDKRKRRRPAVLGFCTWGVFLPGYSQTPHRFTMLSPAPLPGDGTDGVVVAAFPPGTLRLLRRLGHARGRRAGGGGWRAGWRGGGREWVWGRAGIARITGRPSPRSQAGSETSGRRITPGEPPKPLNGSSARR